jgi:phage-related protein
MMPDNTPSTPEFDWRLTSFEGARREQLRRWAQLPLERILLAIEEMQDIAQAFGTTPVGEYGQSVQELRVNEPPVEYGKGGAD